MTVRAVRAEQCCEVDDGDLVVVRQCRESGADAAHPCPEVVRQHEGDLRTGPRRHGEHHGADVLAQVGDPLLDVGRVPAHRVARAEPLLVELAIDVWRLPDHQHRDVDRMSGVRDDAGYEFGHSWQSAGA